MKLAIMQPYFFPYIGYWQLIYAVDRFVIYDDVNYIKGGWINRNRILINGEPTYITVPLHQASPNKKICDISLQSSPVWRGKMTKTVENTYRKSPYFNKVFPVVENVISFQTDSLSDYLAHQIRTMTTFMGLDTDFVMTSRNYGNKDLSGQDRVLDICKREGADTYINPHGGQSLYGQQPFLETGVRLFFLGMTPLTYKQRSKVFVPYLSVVDALMEIGPKQIRKYLEAFDLLEPQAS